ncbi:T7SS effector LXG polymorphic toxin [Listeria monocytogenes]|uniref:T7SS effector LXG polymorphic toxin n=1 Tax=Listeria monocytogenes TaxID=1639 RepID=UPI002AFF2CFA|nr:T7SS effector LXG polymorphic toxin [Listeria monocytogenes]
MTRIDIAEVNHFSHELKIANQQAKTQITSIQNAIAAYLQDDSLSGEAISASKEYYAATYLPLCASIKQALHVSEESLRKYITDFHSQVDSSPSAKIDADGLYELDQKINRLENKLEHIQLELSSMTAVSRQGEINALQTQIFASYKKEQLLEKFLDFERGHSHFFQEISDLARAINRGVRDIQANISFNSQTGMYKVDKLSASNFERLVDLYASQKAIDDKVKAMEDIGMLPYIPEGNRAGYVTTNGKLNTEATLDLVSQQMIYWQNETGMRELFGVGAFYRAVYGLDAVTAERIGGGQRLLDGSMVFLQYVGAFGVSGFYAEFGQVRKLVYLPTSGIKLKTSPWETTTVLGTFKDDTKYVLEELGNIKSTDFSMKKNRFNLLNTPDDLYKTPNQFWAEYNQPWLDKVIARNDDVILSTEPIEDNLYRINRETGLKELTGFGKEYNYLLEHGYKYDSKSSKMIKK